MAEENQKICFVVMGFGKKTAYSSDNKARVLDLDATYEAIIEPAVKEAGLKCIRADKMLISGMIDTPMYEMLFCADLVIADISTGNVNAVYELGVRHALRPFSTILMQEEDAAFHFDLAHISTLTYQHLGEDIGSREAAQKKAKLRDLIDATMEAQQTDSPVYGFLTGLTPPTLPQGNLSCLQKESREKGDDLGELIREGTEAVKKDRFDKAIASFSSADKIISSEANRGEGEVGQSEREYVIQQLAFATYKSQQPTMEDALHLGLNIIERLRPDDSHDVETLGIAGSIRKRLWEVEAQSDHLDKAIEYYGRGFNLKNDYYNGENYALCLDMRSDLQAIQEDAVYDAMTAKKVRGEIIRVLEEEFASSAYEERTDKLWMDATMANAHFALGLPEDAQQYEDRFKALVTAKWQEQTYEEGKQKVLQRQDAVVG